MQTVEQQVGVEALEEWADHPVTEWLAKTIRDRADVAKTNRGLVFAPGDPQKTQENIAYLNGAIDELEDWYQALNSIVEPEEDHPLNSMTVEADDEQ